MLIYFGIIRSLTGVISALLNPMWGLNISCNLDMSSFHKKKARMGRCTDCRRDKLDSNFLRPGRPVPNPGIAIDDSGMRPWAAFRCVCKSYMESHKINSS